jgi:hypothetical protein
LFREGVVEIDADVLGELVEEEIGEEVEDPDGPVGL